jgi:hypothetical protein
MKKLLMYVVITLIISDVYAMEAKEADLDLITDESQVPAYTLPPLLLTAEGNAVTTTNDWINNRRPQILSLFSNLIYGRVPQAKYPVQTNFKLINSTPDFMDGLATRQTVAMEFSNQRGKVESVIQVFIPNAATKPAPAVMILGFTDTQSNGFDADPAQPGMIKAGWPVGMILRSGFALVAVDESDLVDHNEVEFGDATIQHLFYDDGQSFPRAHEWGVISTVAWSASRALDYLQTLSSVDHTRVAVMGHSKLGKAALWAAAQDQRFALVVAAQSGAAGAAMWRRKFGETLQKMVTRYPYWLCRNAWKFVGNEADLPVDQHMLLALIAPRPLYIASGQDDTWADPRGEYLSAWHASEVYQLFGLKGLQSEQSPAVDEPVKDGMVGYHIRKGGHSVEEFDWVQFMDFAGRL